MAAILKVYNTVAAKLPKLDVRNGNLIFVTDTRKIYLDINGNRLCYDTIQTFEKDSDRQAMLAPAEGFYYVEDTALLWRYSGGTWRQLTPDNLNPIVYGSSVADFPTQGNSKLLYITDEATYRWDPSGYVMVANKTFWGSLE